MPEEEELNAKFAELVVSVSPGVAHAACSFIQYVVHVHMGAGSYIVG
jgi:hypothetical protein